MIIHVEIPIDEDGPKSVQELMQVLVRIWTRYHSKPGRALPSLYSSGIIYQPESNVGQYEQWKRPMQTYEDGHGDCDDLTLYRTVELRCRGIDAHPQTLAQRLASGTKMHERVVVGGSVEDPSIILNQPNIRHL